MYLHTNTDKKTKDTFLLFADLNEFAFPSVSACPSSANSPILIRRDSILKHSGSVKNTDRRVSIKQNQPVVLEYLSEKRHQQSSLQPQMQQQLPLQQQQQPAPNPAQTTSTSNSVNQTSARPVSLVLSKGDRPTFKLLRTPSIDQEPDETLVKYEPRLLVSKDDEDDDESVPLVQNNSKEANITTNNNSQNVGNM